MEKPRRTKLARAALLVAAAASGCAPLEWHRPGVGPRALEQDLAACREAARARAAHEAWPFSLLAPRLVAVGRSGRLVVVIPPPPETERFLLEQDLARACMQEKGYTLVPVAEREGAPER